MGHSYMRLSHKIRQINWNMNYDINCYISFRIQQTEDKKIMLNREKCVTIKKKKKDKAYLFFMKYGAH